MGCIGADSPLVPAIFLPMTRSFTLPGACFLSAFSPSSPSPILYGVCIWVWSWSSPGQETFSRPPWNCFAFVGPLTGRDGSFTLSGAFQRAHPRQLLLHILGLPYHFRLLSCLGPTGVRCSSGSLGRCCRLDLSQRQYIRRSSEQPSFLPESTLRIRPG